MGSCALPGNFRRRLLLSPANRQGDNNGENELCGHRDWPAKQAVEKIFFFRDLFSPCPDILYINCEFFSRKGKFERFSKFVVIYYMI